jgi:uncharacterized ferritin-like protein (DUF455 family)
MTPISLRQQALALLCVSDPAQKANQTRELFESIAQLNIDPTTRLIAPANLPGRPALPRLVSPKDVPTRSAFTAEGRAALLHAIAHIEFNAIKIEYSLGTDSWKIGLRWRWRTPTSDSAPKSRNSVRR